MASTGKSRTIIRPDQGGAWKILFRNPIQGTFTDKPLINRTILSILSKQHDLDEESHFKVEARLRGGCIQVSHVVKCDSDEGMHVHELITSLSEGFILD